MLRQIDKIRSFLLAVSSFARHGDAPLGQYLAREEVCLKCPELVVTPTNQFCRACECPRWAVSDMRTKWRMRDIKCPLGKW